LKEFIARLMLFLSAGKPKDEVGLDIDNSSVLSPASTTMSAVSAATMGKLLSGRAHPVTIRKSHPCRAQ
jgi:hypothetical protein